ncbi:uncharacterized protein EAE98_001507 [Botrytis deweyae]|uniref:LDB19 N-terminal domain-containing protein n=1 Tax=Botrytis deweyae TaxID=2478750 RepID=A0ABQ7IYZ0_9HELO|nr:uncharacterized protein EAE98_001507 [Botrytis deweyae]KAF7937193.1 hypothetical protein EAE98_001507 [Botrytis deweyae]
MTYYMKKQCKSISRRISEVPNLKTISERKSSLKISPIEEPSRDKTTRKHQTSQDLQRSQDTTSEKIQKTFKNVITSKNKNTNTTSPPLQKSKEPSSTSSESTIINTTISDIPSTIISSTIPPTTKSNKNGPDEKYQINSHLLFESSFPGHTFISVHLQRLQHGIYSDANLHTKHTLHVTFVALSFIFHPSTPAHRFESAVIDIKIRDQRGNLRFLKYAPHQAYGKISTESLKWNFQLGASLGVTQGPANVCVKPSIGEEKSKVVGTMMKIQGSTRSTFEHSIRYPDTLLHFSLEENAQQESGLPREFTFVFLLERPSEKQYPPVHTFHSSRLQTLEHCISEKLRSMSGRGRKNEDEEENCMEYRYEDIAGEKRTPRLEVERLDGDFEKIFGEVEFEIGIEPKISNTLALPSLSSSLPTIPRTGGSIHNSAAHTETARVLGEVGQKFPTEGTLDSMGKVEHEEAIVHGLYNFAKLEGAFEEQVSLPGESVGSRVPELGGGGTAGGK